MTLLEGVLARKDDQQKIELLRTSTRAALFRQQAALVECLGLRSELRRVEALFAEASLRNEASLSAYRASLDRALAETRAQCEHRLRAMSEELEKAKAALKAAEEGRDLLFATILQHVMTMPPLPLIAEGGRSLAAEQPLSERSRRAMFRDETQACAAIRILLEKAGLERLWTADGPTPEAEHLRAAEVGMLGTTERRLLLAAHDLWNGQGGLAFADAAQLSGEAARALFSLAKATSTSPAAVDEWLSEAAAGAKAVRC
jgi:hypothetical protein